MSHADARDAYLYVEIDHPNGELIRGRMIPWDDSVAIIAQIQGWDERKSIKELVEIRAKFLSLSGIPESAVADLHPGGLVNFIYRFFARPPLARTTPGGSSDTGSAPSSDPSPPASASAT